MTTDHPPVVRRHRIPHTCPAPDCLACHIAADATATRREDTDQ